LTEINSNKVCGDTLCSVGITTTTITPVVKVIENYSDNPDIELLFIQSSTSGTFEQRDGQKILTLVGISPATVYFSDRPYRITGFEDTESFVGLWSNNDADSFASDPPNAALEMHDSNDEQSEIFIIELTNPIYDPKAETLQYTIEILAEASDGLTHYNDRNDSKIPATFDDAVLFIDGFHFKKWLKKTFITDNKQRPPPKSLIPVPDVPVTPTDLLVMGGEAAGHVAQNEYQKILEHIDIGNWEEHAFKYSLKMRIASANAGADFGESIGGEKGRAIGSRVGDSLGAAAATTITKTISSGKIDKSSLADNLDTGALTTSVIDAIHNTANNYLIAYTITDNMLTAQGQNIVDTFLTQMQLLGTIDTVNDTQNDTLDDNTPIATQNAKLRAAYAENNFCGSSSNDEFIEKVLSKVFLFYLRLTLESWILHDLNEGMTYDQIKVDINENLTGVVDRVIMNTFWSLQDLCLSDEDNDLYTLIFNQLFIPYNAEITLPIGTVVSDEAGLPADFVTTAEAYPGHYAKIDELSKLPQVQLGDSFPKVENMAPELSDSGYRIEVGGDLFLNRSGSESATQTWVETVDALNILNEPAISNEPFFPNTFNLGTKIANDIDVDLLDGLDSADEGLDLFIKNTPNYFNQVMQDAVTESVEESIIDDVPK